MTSEPVMLVEPIEPHQLGFGRLFDRARDAVVVGEAGSGRIVLWNPAAERLLGYSLSEALGLSIEDLVPPELKARHRDGIANYGRTGNGNLIDSEQVAELPALHKDGHIVHVELTLSPLDTRPDLPGRFVLAILRDVTDRRLLQEDLVRANERLREMDELRRDYLAMVAHDVRGPMTGVLGFADLLGGDDLTEDQRRTALDAIERSARRVTLLTEDLMLASALETANVSVNMEQVAVIDAVTAAASSIREQFPDVVIKCDIPPDLAVKADRERLWQVLMNLFSNAAKYNPPDHPIDVRGVCLGDEVVITVRDYGIGIALEDRPKLFQRFGRLEDKSDIPGTGLGLFVCRELLALMGGTITVPDTVGAGTTFLFTLSAP